jgi:Terminase RNaseH-like domain
MDMLTRMQTGRFKVFNHLTDWWEEFRLYHRKDGLVHKEGDDLMAATRNAIMMLRHASTAKSYKDFRRPFGLSEAEYLLMRRPFVIWRTLKCEHGQGSWAIIDGMVFVRTCNGHKATQIGGSNPEGLARMLIRELSGECRIARN